LMRGVVHRRFHSRKTACAEVTLPQPRRTEMPYPKTVRPLIALAAISLPLFALASPAASPPKCWFRKHPRAVSVSWLFGFLLLAGYLAMPGARTPQPEPGAKPGPPPALAMAGMPSIAATTPDAADTSYRLETKNIEDVVEGDFVLAWDEETGEMAARPVVRTFPNTSDHLCFAGRGKANR